MTEEVDVCLMLGMSKNKSGAKCNWEYSTIESIILMTYYGHNGK